MKSKNVAIAVHEVGFSEVLFLFDEFWVLNAGTERNEGLVKKKKNGEL